MSSPYYAKKILFNITKLDLDRMDDTRGKMNLEKSEFIRRAIRSYVAEQKLAEFERRYISE
jgi:metal-responsive CopG/Arc/MetJ family transcriptional regulator